MTVGGVSVCACHGEPCYWRNDLRAKAGGYWRCAVKERERQRNRYDNHPTYRDTKLQQQRDRYDSDPIYRIEKNMKTGAKRRAETLNRRREALYG
jgi:hypothetical protein